MTTSKREQCNEWIRHAVSLEILPAHLNRAIRVLYAHPKELYVLSNHLFDCYKLHSVLQPFSTCVVRGRKISRGKVTIVTLSQLLHSGRANDSPTYCSCDQTVSSLRNPSGPARLSVGPRETMFILGYVVWWTARWGNHKSCNMHRVTTCMLVMTWLTINIWVNLQV